MEKLILTIRLSREYIFIIVSQHYI